MAKAIVCALCAVYLVLSQTAGDYVEANWSAHGVPDIKQNEDSRHRQLVPTLSYEYHPSYSRLRHHQGSRRNIERQGSFYVSPPKVQVANSEHKSSIVDMLSSSERKSQIPTSGVYRTYGRGQAVIPYPGATVHVPKTVGTNKAYTGVVSARVFAPPKTMDSDAKDVISRSRRDCAGCPKDEIVIASKGHAFVYLPEPCSYRWQTLTGPKPGSKLTEGVHYITGTMANRRKLCRYRYEVKVNRCSPPPSQSIAISCTADNAWGSRCTYICPRNKKLDKNAVNECGDDLQWTNSEPMCNENYDCLVPNIENGTKINCETNEISEIDNSYLPEGAYCRLIDNGMETAVKCRKGEWKKVSHLKGKHKRNKKQHGKERRKNQNNSQCEPNPCLQGGTCLISGKELHKTYICLCRPATEGPRCEFSECVKNPCKNNGRCLEVNGDAKCYCQLNFAGEFCESTQ